MSFRIVLVASVSALFMIVGCSGDDTPSSSSSASSTTSSASSSSSGASGDGGSSGTSGSSSGTSGSSSGSSGSSEGPLSCNYPDDHNCISFSSAPAGAGATYCMAGSTIGTACPTADLYATCTYMTSGITEVNYYYGAANWNQASLKMACDSLQGTLVVM